MTFEKIAEYVGHKDSATTRRNYSYDTNSTEANLKMLNSGLNYALESL